MQIIRIQNKILKVIFYKQLLIIIISQKIQRNQDRMSISPKNNLDMNSNLDRDIIFPQENYQFRGLASKTNQFAKTCIKKKFTSEQINKITKIYHKNVIGLKKIGKSKKATEQQIFWLYYEVVPYSLEMTLTKSQIDITPEFLQNSLNELKNYLTSLKIYPSFNQLNIGANQNGTIKVYIPVQSILKQESNQKKAQFYDGRIKQIKQWYLTLYSRSSIKPNQPKISLDKKLSQSKLNNNIVQIRYDFEKMRKKFRSEQSKNGSVVGSPCEDKKIKNINIQGQPPHSIVINVYNQKSPKQIKNSQSKQKVPQYRNNNHPIQNIINSNNKQLRPVQKYQYQYDDESVDTYQMEMGQDFEWPSMRTNQKLRQTLLNDKKSWDTLTHKSPTNVNKIDKIHQSAGKKGFKGIIQANQNILRNASLRRLDGGSDNKTVQESHFKQKKWQQSSIKSALPPDIQDRVQQALAKTKNVMQMLKNTKSFSAGK